MHINYLDILEVIIIYEILEYKEIESYYIEEEEIILKLVLNKKDGKFNIITYGNNINEVLLVIVSLNELSLFLSNLNNWKDFFKKRKMYLYEKNLLLYDCKETIYNKLNIE